ncbi:hypothetical protein I316_07133 [Kwoniella heveanensis BCC8398]|uniref:Uncharacterized protein n=1 Tax=Kwoniella heveanensis BCC8398 TaxID=1296120 RepID=A0A1B9GJM2_9TREE|nr:hypothetical protein I316_07133 [Kwoniella heveanensis BCC8398]
MDRSGRQGTAHRRHTAQSGYGEILVPRTFSLNVDNTEGFAGSTDSPQLELEFSASTLRPLALPQWPAGGAQPGQPLLDYREQFLADSEPPQDPNELATAIDHLSPHDLAFMRENGLLRDPTQIANQPMTDFGTLSHLATTEREPDLSSPATNPWTASHHGRSQRSSSFPQARTLDASLAPTPTPTGAVASTVDAPEFAFSPVQSALGEDEYRSIDAFVLEEFLASNSQTEGPGGNIPS